MASPSMTLGAAGNAQASTSLAAGATLTTFTVDFSAVWEGQLQIGATFGTVAALAGLLISIYPRIGSTPVNDTVAGAGSGILTAVASTSQAQTIKLPTGRYAVSLKNLDTTNGLTAVYATFDTISGVA